MKKILNLLIYLLIVSNCAAQIEEDIDFSLFMIGHVGNFDQNDSMNVQLIRKIFDYNENEKGLLFLGNNVYPGLHDILSEDFDELVSDSQFDLLEQFDGPIAFVPGLTDWALGSASGKDMIKWEYKTVEKRLEDSEIYMIDWGCPGPVEINVNDSLTIILMDTQWLLHPYDTRMGKCDLDNKDDFWVSLEDALRRNQDKEIVVAGYHPVISHGEYGGNFSTIESLLTLPVAAYRKYLGTRLDLAHPAYKLFSEELKNILEEFPNVIYASSHEQNFQYFHQNEVHYVIGGSLNGGGYVNEKKVVSGSEDVGFSKLDFYKDGKVVLSFFSGENLNSPACTELLYVYQKGENRINTAEYPLQSLPDTILHAASHQYENLERSYKWMGKNYRDVWATDIKVPVFNIRTEYGGLEVIKRGGGQQTHSLRLQAEDGHQYVLRSLEKFVEGALPNDLDNTIAVDIAQDNISASNPYASLAVAKLAEVAGVYHTNPKVVYMPDDKWLAEYNKDVAGNLFLFEERPNGDWSTQASFGFSPDIIGTDDVLSEIEEDPTNRVDQQFVLRSRLFDTFINDWDRHDDQWRWASFKNGENTVFKPIPRDRDQAFYLNEGILPWIASRKWLLPKLQGFDTITSNMDGLAFNARYFDRTFLTGLDWNEWKLTVDSLQQLLTDDKIDQAMNAFPEEVQPLIAGKTAQILKARRNNLETMARQHYLSLAKSVDVIGTDEEDLFRLSRIDNENTELTVFEISKEHEIKQQYYQRTFKTSETKEINLYGLGKDDLFEFEGVVENGPIVRVVGGKGKDTIQNSSQVKKWGKQTLVYDLKKNTTIEGTSDTKNNLSNNKRVNHYDRTDFTFDVVKPAVFTGYSPDDGIFIGGGPEFYSQHFRRDITHTIKANFATRTNAFNVDYSFDSEAEVNGLDHHFSYQLKAPDYAINYFGKGNASIKNDLYDDSYYRVRVNQHVLEYKMGQRFGETAFDNSVDGSINESELRWGVFFKSSNVEDETVDGKQRFIADLENNGLKSEDLEKQFFSGLSIGYKYAYLDDENDPKRGVKLYVEGKQYMQLNEKNSFLKLNADLNAYLSFTKDPRTVLAFRLGGSRIFGDFAFQEAARLGGKTNLRGYLRDRFYGDQSIYQNTEIRYKLFDYSSYILSGELGFLGFYDSGKVWMEGEDNSGEWHKGYGAGLWLSPFRMTIFTATYNWSNEDEMIQLNLNFQF